MEVAVVENRKFRFTTTRFRLGLDGSRARKGVGAIFAAGFLPERLAYSLHWVPVKRIGFLPLKKREASVAHRQ